MSNKEDIEQDDMLPEYNFDYSKAKRNRFANNQVLVTVTLDADVAKVLEVADLDGHVVTLLLLSVKVDFSLEDVFAVVDTLNTEPGSGVGIGGSVDLERERRPVLLGVVIVSDEVTHDAGVLVLRPDESVGHVQERSVVVDVFQDDLKLDETLDARGSAVLVLGVDVGRPLRVTVGKVPVELLDDPDLSRLLVDAEVRRDLEQESHV